jgi:hypothetical protein
MLREILCDRLVRLKQRWPDAGINACGRGRLPWTLQAVVPAREVAGIAAAPGVADVSIQNIKGLRRRLGAGGCRQLDWYCVWGNVAIQIEGRSRGMVSLEDRLVLLKANDEQDAKKRLRMEWRMYAQPYMNSSGHLVRWQLVRVLDVYQLVDAEINPKGTEVFSRFTEKRMCPAYAWRARVRGA